MKSITIIIGFLLAGVYAVDLPQVQDEVAIQGRNTRFVDDIISSALEDLSNDIREAGLDPWIFESTGLDIELPVPVVLSIHAVVENIVFTGLSNIVINRINYAILSGRLTLDISLPELSIYIGKIALDAVALGADINVHISGRFSVIEPRVSGEVLINVLGIIGGNLIRSMDLEFDLEGMQYNGRINVLGVDLSQRVSDFVSINIPNAVSEHREDINELVEILARQIVDDLL